MGELVRAVGAKDIALPLETKEEPFKLCLVRESKINPARDPNYKYLVTHVNYSTFSNKKITKVLSSITI